MFLRILFLITITSHIVWCQYDLSDVVQGTRMSVNDDMFVSASNAFSNFAVIMHPFRNSSNGGPIRCNMRYNTTDRFVHSVAVVGITKNNNNSEHFMFVFAAETMSTMIPYVCIATIATSTCISSAQCTNMSTGGSYQQYFLIGVDTNGSFAYGFTSSFVFQLDIYANEIILNLTTNSVWPSSGFIPHAMDVADTWAVVAGYGYSDVVKQNYQTLGCFINLSVLINASCVSITSETTYLVPANVVSYNELYELSVAIRSHKVLIGVYRLSTVVILRNLGSSLNITNSYSLSYPDATTFGRVVNWADDTTIAILVDNAYETSWSTSEIFVYDENSVTLTSPIFNFPNNQQILGSRLSQPSFARFGITVNGNMAILTGHADILIIPVAPAGYTSIWVDTTALVFVFYFEPMLCIGGTYKNRSSLGPCQICPPDTRNPGTLSDEILQCIPCSDNTSTSFCPLASLVDIDLNTVSAYSQVLAYPETAETTNIEDLLIENMFQISSNKHCLLISPLLWTLIVSGLCFFVLILMVIIKLCGCHQCLNCRQRAKVIFKHTDIIGEGEMWAGGLASLSIIVLVSFSYWFSASFIQRYPIENVFEPAKFACDETLMNAQFSTGLALLAIPKSEDSQPIFDLLDQQIFQLTIELINSGFTCTSIAVQENLITGKYIHLAMNCLQLVSAGITSVTFPFPSHQTSVQINMTGPYWIGAIRLCIRGQGQENMSSTLRQLDFCQLYTTPNENIGRLTSIPIVFIKNINMTQALDTGGPTIYSGLWMPTFSTVSLSDEAYYLEFGNYLRYTSSLTILQITLSEHPFFIKNMQQPIVRTAELIFHGLLFTSLCIELFAFSFLIVKLLIIPLFRWIGYLWKKFLHRNDKSTESNTSVKALLKSNPLIKGDSIWNLEINQTMALESDSSKEQRRCSTSEIELNAIEIKSKL
jgi:hypothetical protein